jgi:putative oxidoreductase
VAAEFLGNLCILFGVATRLIATLMVVFAAFTAVLGHPFWAADPASYQGQYINFMKNVAIMGGYLALFISGPGAISLDGRLRWPQLEPLRQGGPDRLIVPNLDFDESVMAR